MWAGTYVCTRGSFHCYVLSIAIRTHLVLEAHGEGDAELGGEGVEGGERPAGEEDGAHLLGLCCLF